MQSFVGDIVAVGTRNLTSPNKFFLSLLKQPKYLSSSNKLVVFVPVKQILWQKDVEMKQIMLLRMSQK